MMSFENIILQISAAVEREVREQKNFFVDITSNCRYGDICSNAPMIFGKSFDVSYLPFVAEVAEVNGFLNVRLKDSVFTDYIGSFASQTLESMPSDRLEAYIQLAELEKKHTGVKNPEYPLTDEVRRFALCLMKAEYLAKKNREVSKILYGEAISLLKKIESESENLKSFIIEFEPLLLAARGSLAKLS